MATSWWLLCAMIGQVSALCLNCRRWQPSTGGAIGGSGCWGQASPGHRAHQRSPFSLFAACAWATGVVRCPSCVCPLPSASACSKKPCIACLNCNLTINVNVCIKSKLHSCGCHVVFRGGRAASRIVSVHLRLLRCNAASLVPACPPIIMS